VIVIGQFGGVWLASEGVQCGVSPRIGDQHLVWEVSVAHLRQCRIRKVMLSVEVWRDKEMLGHLVMDLGTAVPLHTKQDEAPVKGYCLIGSGASLELSLGLDEVEILYTCNTDSEGNIHHCHHQDRTQDMRLYPSTVLASLHLPVQPIIEKDP
jgi:hypothetical protein